LIFCEQINPQMQNNPIKFYSTKDQYGVFSNFSKHKIGLDGTTWATTEHYFQAQKFENPDIQRQIQAAKTPSEAAKMGRDRNNPLRKDWEAVKDAVMKKALYAKVMQHAEVRQTLLNTGDATLIEHTKNDHYWADGGDGTGKNMLGIILMEIREELKKDGADHELKDLHLPIWMQCPDIERYSIGWRLGDGEDVLWKFSLWWRGISEAGRLQYEQMYPEPKGWRGWYKDKDLRADE
jgi:N-glycosidase YbiA